MATTMQPEIPWNVAGIAPEARDAARTSARREGLSVGEWLTRRILRGLPEAQAASEEWWFAENGRTPSNENPVQNGHQLNNDPLRSLLLRTDESRQGQGAIRGAAVAHIKSTASAASEDSEPLNERIVRLDARIARIEIRAAAEEAKHAATIKDLRAKMAGLTDQLSKTASRNAAQDAQLAKAIEGVAGKFLQSDSAADEQRSAINARIVTLAEDTAAVGEQIAQTRDESERQLRTVEDRVVAIELAVETVRHTGDDVNRLGGSLDQLTQRLESNEAEYLGNIERFETRLTRIEAEPGEANIDRRLQSIEQALADMTKLIEKNAPQNPAPSDTFEKAESAPPQPDLARLRDAAPHVPPSGAGTAMPILDLPPFPEKPNNKSAPPPDSAFPAQDLRASGPSADPFDGSNTRRTTPELESLLAAARQSARAESPSQPRNASFSWVDSAGEKQPEGTRTRLIALGALGLLIVAAVGTGLYLSKNIYGIATVPQVTTNPVHYAVVTTGRQPQATRLPASPTSAAKQAAGAAASNMPAVEAAATAHSRVPDVQKRAVGSANGVRTEAAKPRTSLQRLAALAASGNAKAQEVLGLAYLDGDGVAVNEAEGAKWLERAATRGEAVAAYRLGTLYERGHGVAADPAKGAQWYALAAKAGNRKAMHNLAVAYAQGSGVQKNLTLAAQWFSRAANLGLADSQFDLAVLYERGLGVPHNLGQAYKWYAIAAAQGDTESRTRMETLGPQLSADDKAAAEKSAAAFQPERLDHSANAPPIAGSLVGAG